MNEKCSHLYSRSISEPRPRKCELCGELELIDLGVYSFDFKKFKEYVKTYPIRDVKDLSADFVFNDMLYGMGIYTNVPEIKDIKTNKNFEFGDGYIRFKTFLKQILF